MMPPLASSLPDTGRKRTETSTSANFWSSSTATAHGCVSTVWARTWRPPDARRTHWPATNFHLGFSEPRSYFTVIVSPAAMANVVTPTSNTAASTTFMRLPPSLSPSVQTYRDDLPVVAAHKRDLGERPAAGQGRHRADGAVSGVGLDRVGRGLPERPFRARHRRLLA